MISQNRRYFYCRNTPKNISLSFPPLRCPISCQLIARFLTFPKRCTYTVKKELCKKKTIKHTESTNFLNYESVTLTKLWLCLINCWFSKFCLEVEFFILAFHLCLWFWMHFWNLEKSPSSIWGTRIIQRNLNCVQQIGFSLINDVFHWTL